MNPSTHVWDWLYGLTTCPLCQRQPSRQQGCCEECAQQIRASLEPQQLAFELTLGVYGGILEKAVQAYKFHGTPRLHILFAALLASEWRKASYLAATHDARASHPPVHPDIHAAARQDMPNHAYQNVHQNAHQNAPEDTLTPWQVDVVCAVPLHWQRYLSRGYNQAALLARHLAKLQHVPYQPLLSRRRATQQQAKLDADARLANISGAFVSQPASGKRVLLVDDVLTTRATTTECALALLEAGATCVYCVGIVRAHH